MKPTVISTFAGCGGSSLGYKMAGYEALAAVEWDAIAAETYRTNFPDTPLLERDVASVTADELLELTRLAKGELDVLDGSPPCQGFSTAGKRVLEDPRNTLFREFTRLLDGLQPRTFVMENVSGLVKGKMKWVFRRIMRELKACGYDVRCKLLDAAWFGVPQHRRRLIWIGIRNDLKVRPIHPLPQARTIPVRNAINDLDDVQSAETEHVWIDESPLGRNTKTWHLAFRASQGMLYAGQQRRGWWNRPAYTLLKPSNQEMAVAPYLRNSGCHPIFTRTYSLLEYKRLSSFPDDFICPDDWKWGFFHIGNAVPPLFMKAIANAIRVQMS